MVKVKCVKSCDPFVEGETYWMHDVISWEHGYVVEDKNGELWLRNSENFTEVF